MTTAPTLPHRSFTTWSSLIISLVATLGGCQDPSRPVGPRFAICGGPNCGSDQGQLVVDATADPLTVGGSSQQILGQVVTADSTGQVVEIRMPVSCSGTALRLDIRNVNPDGTPTTPSTAPTFTRLIPNSQVNAPLDGTLHALSIGGGFRVVAGNRFAIVLSVVDTTGSCGVQQGPVGDPYAFGDGWFIALPNPLDVWAPISIATGRFDLPFETFVRVR